MSKHVRWLHEQLAAWVADGVLSSEQAGQIRQRYPELRSSPPWGTIIFAGLGAVVFGLGIILLFAYNWHAIPKSGKLGVIFLSILASHGAGLRLAVRRDWQRPLGEALTLLGTMLYGAGIWLVAQIYHIEEHFPNGFLLWALGALALAWAMPSIAQGILSVVLLCVWGCSEAWGFDRPMHLAPFLILLAVGGLAWRLRSRLLLVFVLAGFNVSILATAGALQGGLVLPVCLNLAVAFVAAGKLCRRFEHFVQGAAVWEFFGWLGFLVSLYLLTFSDLQDDLLNWMTQPQHTQSPRVWVLTYAWGALAAAMLPWVPIVAESAQRGKGRSPAYFTSFEEWLLPLTALWLQLICLTELLQEHSTVAGVFNLVFLALSAAWMSRGCRQGLVQPTVLGSLLFTALAIARYFDLFENLLVRGLVFLAVGGVLFTEGILFMRARRRAREVVS